jgi:hypothetical protein
LLQGVEECFKGVLPRVNLSNEIQAWGLIKEMAELSMTKYPNGLEEDIELLKNDKLTFNEKNCIQYRKGEKEILHYLIDCAGKVNQLSKMTSKEAK